MAGVAGFDALATASSLLLAFLVRFDADVPASWWPTIRSAALVLAATRVALGALARLHRWAFRMAGFAEAVRLVLVTILGSLLFAAVLSTAFRCHLPRSVAFLELFFTTSLMGGFRYAPRLGLRLYGRVAGYWRAGIRRTLIVGAGSAGERISRDLHHSPAPAYYVVGFVDDDPEKLGTTIDGKPVLGCVDDLPALLERQRATMVLLAVPDMPAERIRSMLQTCSRAKASFKIIPSGLGEDRLSAAMLHDLSPEDLLPREAVRFDHEEIRALVAGRRVLVTGAGGSIGGEILRQVALHGAEQIVAVDMNENELYLKARRLREEHPGVSIHTEVANIRERERLDRLGRRYRPHYVFHAAAHKHVPLMEEAPEEAIKNNVFGTLNAARMADACGAERFVLISTDKAVSPSSVMGASKRIAELVVRDLAKRSSTRMMAVRFGNVLGSAGSVVPIFKQQIERGGPVTVTHPECTRYFMTIPEAVGLVLLAGLGGYGDLCVLDMGEPIKILELARNLVTMAGYVPGEEIPIVFTGLRPGEKLEEELLTEEEERTYVMRDRILAAESPEPPADLAERLAELRQLAEADHRQELLRAIRRIVPTYCHTPNAAPAAKDGARAPALQLVEGSTG